jgi:hypothetical protein
MAETSELESGQRLADAGSRTHRIRPHGSSAAHGSRAGGGLPAGTARVTHRARRRRNLGRGVYERLGFVALLRFTYWLGLRSG